jgi:hypothetical protein
VTVPFDPTQGPIVIEAELSGPTGRSSLRLLLDTGATESLVDPLMLVAVGHDPDTSRDHVQVAMGGGIATVPRVTLNRLKAFGKHRVGFRVLSHQLPAAAGVDGLLGLDFFRREILTLDFRAGVASLS